jgi:hypothetical protein
MSTGRHRRSERDRELRLEAMQIAIQLPKSKIEALRVLVLVERLVCEFLEKGSAPALSVVRQLDDRRSSARPKQG